VAEEQIPHTAAVQCKVSSQKTFLKRRSGIHGPRGKSNKITRLRGIEASQYTSRGNQQSEQDDQDIYLRLSQAGRSPNISEMDRENFEKKRQVKSRIPLLPLHSPGPHKQHRLTQTGEKEKRNEWRKYNELVPEERSSLGQSSLTLSAADRSRRARLRRRGRRSD